MKKTRIYLLLFLVVAMTVVFCTKGDQAGISGPYLGQQPPGETPVLFAPGIVSTGLDELNNVFNPGMNEFYFCVRQYPNLVSIFQIRSENGNWSEPQLLPFASPYGDIDVTVSPDGQKLLFCSRRPLKSGDPPREDYDFWFSERQGESWSGANHLGEGINSGSHDFYPIMTESDAIYFSSQRQGPGTNNVYRSVPSDGVYGPAEKMGSAINSEYREFDPYVTPDESMMIFTSSRPGGYGGADLYISFKQADGAWTRAENLGERVNSPGAEFCAMMTPHGKYLFFTSARRNSPSFIEQPVSYKAFWENHRGPGGSTGDIYWVDAGIINALRPIE